MWDKQIQRWYTEAWRTANPELTDAAAAMIAATPAEGYAGCCEALDPATPPSHRELMGDRVQDGLLLTLPYTAHDEQPAVITIAVLEHLGALS